MKKVSRSSALDIHPKVAASALGSWITVIGLYSADHWGHLVLPSFVAAAVLGIVTFICGYVAPPE